jgi:NAD(P)-dependent dehydrogenase (short-subunit alcohol dehydrogenase family)
MGVGPAVTGDLFGRHALITGAGRGIGRAASLHLAREGARVTVVARSEPELEELAAEISADGGVADVIAADVTDADGVARVVEQAGREQELDICVNSAGTNRPAPTVEVPLEDFEYVMDVNVRGTFLVCQSVGAAMIAAGTPGRIVNVSSQMGTVGYPGRAVYCASKHAVNGLTKALGVEWAPYGITVNAVAPTFIETPLTKPMLANPEFRADVLSRIPLGRVGTVDEVAAAILFLVSPKAALVTGSIIPVDGGWVAW